MEPTQRGNSQYALELHHLLWEIHGVQVGPLHPRIGLPDCMGLFVDFEELYTKHYSDLFKSLEYSKGRNIEPQKSIREADRFPFQLFIS